MQARFDLLNRLFNIKSEMEVLIKNIVLYKSSKGFNQKMNLLINQFDIALKQVPKTISFNQNQKPVALQEFYANFQKKVDRRKENLLNRYIREIEQIKSQFKNIAKQSTAKSIEFIEDTQHLEQRFKRQLSIRKQMNSESIESLKKHQKPQIDKNKIEEQFNQIKIKEEERIIQRRKNELKTIELQIESLKQELNETTNQEQNEVNSIDQKIELNQQKLSLLRNQKSDEIEIIRKQINSVQSNIQSAEERLSNLKQTRNEMEKSFQSMIDQFRIQINDQNQSRINQVKKEIESIQNKIFELNKKMSNPIVLLNKESFDPELKKELIKRKELLKSEEGNKRIDWENQIIDKINEYNSILKESFNIDSQSAILKQKIENENQERINNLVKKNKEEMDEINADLMNMRKNYSIMQNSELIRLLTSLTDINIEMRMLEQENNDIEDNKAFKNIKKLNSNSDDIQNIDFFSVSDFFLRKELNNINKIKLIISKLNGQLEELDNNDALISKYQLLLENSKDYQYELKMKENLLNETNKDEEFLFRVENESEILALAADFFFDAIDESGLTISKNEEEDKNEKEEFKKLFIQLKEKQKLELNRLHSIINELNEHKKEFSLSSNIQQLNQLETEFIDKLKNGNKDAKLDLMRKAKKEIEDLKELNLKEAKDDDKLMDFLIRKNHKNYLDSIFNMIKMSNEIEEEIMKNKLKIEKREMTNEENEIEHIFLLKNEIFQLEKSCKEIESHQSHIVNRKAPLPPLKDT